MLGEIDLGVVFSKIRKKTIFTKVFSLYRKKLTNKLYHCHGP